MGTSYPLKVKVYPRLRHQEKGALAGDSSLAAVSVFVRFALCVVRGTWLAVTSAAVCTRRNSGTDRKASDQFKAARRLFSPLVAWPQIKRRPSHSETEEAVAQSSAPMAPPKKAAAALALRDAWGSPEPAGE